MSTLTVLAEEAHELAPLILPLWAFPLIAAAFFLIAFLVTWSYRDVANRWKDKGAAHGTHAHEHAPHDTHSAH